MNIYRSALSACVIVGLPNVHDYIHKHRERLMEEKRQKMIALENQRQLANHGNPGQAGAAAGHGGVFQPMDIVREINAVNARAPNNNNGGAAPAPPPLPMDVDDQND